MTKAVFFSSNIAKLKLTSSTSGLSQILNEALSSICEGICQPLKIRIEKILNVPTQASVLYAVTNLIRYYKKCIYKVTGPSVLETNLVELQERSEQTFLSSLQQQVNNTLVRVEAPPRDLSPTSAVNNLFAILRDMLSTASMSEGRENDMGKVSRFEIYKRPLSREGAINFCFLIISFQILKTLKKKQRF